MSDAREPVDDGLADERRTLRGLIELHEDPNRRDPEYARQKDAIEASAEMPDGVQEAALADATSELRTHLRRRAWHRAAESQASPLTGSRIELRAGQTLDYGYERGLPMTPLESRAESLAATEPGVKPEAVVFGSGMAALATTLEAVIYQFFGDHGRRPRIAALSAYFETSMLLELFGPAIESLAKPSTIEEMAGLDVDIVFLEPVRYDWDLTVTDVPFLCSTWSSRGRVPSYVVTDSTLCPLFWPLACLRRLVADSGKTRLVDVRSGLKLDQQGLELSNLGLSTVFTASSTETTSLSELLRNARAVHGGGLSLASLLVLDSPFVFDNAWLTSHVTRVFRNNAEFARSLQISGGLFRSIAHPLVGTDSTPSGVAPFTVLQLQEDSLDNYRHLVGVVDHEVARRGLQLDFGSSFGFRSHRYETIVPRKSTLRCLMKVALGSRRGPSSVGVMQLFQELSALSSMEQLRRRYPDARPARLAI